MQESTMPAVEAEVVGNEREPVAYEFAFHILPTVAEGEVESVYNTLKEHITKAGGTIFDTEAPERFDLAYGVVKYLEGRNRVFTSAYFGWIRFHLTPAALAGLTEDIDGVKELLRYLLIRLTREEEQAPFRFHEALAETRVKTIGTPDGEVIAADAEVVEEVVEGAPEVAVADATVSGEEVK
ncbi:30S ribosomal protein S6 [Patescibacteria group bacterium]|nr:30S ribosomal protein S6 [Patescibacteria group bacterium]